MTGAPLPTPQYITYADNVEPLIGTDKVLVADDDSTAIPISEANVLVAAGESLALEDLSPYYVTVPNLITTTGGNWTTLPAQTYTILYDMMTYQASLQLIGAFIAKNTDEEGRTLSYFQKYFAAQYNTILSRIADLLPNGSYRYQLIGLQPLCTGIQRKPRRYAATGSLGAVNYTDHQVIDPSRNFDVFWGVNGFGRNGRRGG